MMDYRGLDCGNRPDPAALARDWDRTVVTEIRSSDARLDAFARALGRALPNRRVFVKQFAIVAADAVAWLLTRNRLNKGDFFRHFFGYADVIDAMPIVGEQRDEIENFETIAADKSLEFLTSLTGANGDARLSVTSDKDAAKLARNFLDAVCSSRFSETIVWVNYHSWTAIAAAGWDQSFFWFDTRTGIATVLIVTDLY